MAGTGIFFNTITLKIYYDRRQISASPMYQWMKLHFFVVGTKKTFIGLLRWVKIQVNSPSKRNKKAYLRLKNVD